MIKKINGATYAKMVIAASQNLDINKELVDSLNVFPVPDGDTGTNMSLTMQSAIKELEACKNNILPDLASATAKGALKGARGNSGVITSQIFRGIANIIKNYNEVDTRIFADALQKATDVAYGAVAKPQEGTILTVCRMMSEEAMQICGKIKDFEEFFEKIVAKGQEAVDLTPELLPVLKKAGVVDSGGTGLLKIFEGMLKSLKGETIEVPKTEDVADDSVKQENKEVVHLGTLDFAYYVEFIIMNIKKRTTLADIDKLREYLRGIGDNVLVVGDLNMIKVNVNTNSPGLAITKALALGELDKFKIENLLEKNRALMKKMEEERKAMGMIAVSPGDGLTDIFKDLNVDVVIEGGQTMNPSAQDIADAIMRVNAENVFVFPNNKNIILSAEQSKTLVKGKKIFVVPTKNVPQGISAALAFNPETKPNDNLINMLHEMDNVVAGEVTYAVRNTVSGAFKISKGDKIGLDGKRILAKGKDVAKVTTSLIEKLCDDSHTVLNLYYGSDVKKEDAEKLRSNLESKYKNLDVELFNGGQAIYYYIVSLE